MKNLSFSLTLFQKILKIILIVVMIFYFLGIDIKDVFALSAIGWAEQEDLTLSKVLILDSNGNSAINGTQTTIDTNVSYITFLKEKLTSYRLAIHIPTIETGLLYSFQFYICNNSSTNFLLDFSKPVTGLGWQQQVKPKYSAYYIDAINSKPFTSSSNDFNSCRVYNLLIEPVSQADWLQFSFLSNTSDVMIYFGYKLYPLGNSLESNNQIVNTIINNANSNKQEIVDNQNSNSQAEIDNANKNHNELMDDSNIKVNTDEVNKIQGLFPPGPLDSLLNIPFTFTSKIINAFGGSCKPLIIPTLGGNNWTMDCPGDIIYGKMFDQYLMKFVELIPCCFILISAFKRWYKKLEKATSMEANSDDEWGVI